jgi:hypothetical protein
MCVLLNGGMRSRTEYRHRDESCFSRLGRCYEYETAQTVVSVQSRKDQRV